MSDKDTWIKGALKAKKWLPQAIDQIKADRTQEAMKNRLRLVVVETAEADLKRRTDHLEYLKRRRKC